MKFKVSLIVVAMAVGASGVAAASLAGRSNTYIVHAYFSSAIGLFPDSDVRVLGVPIGKVSSVTPEGDRIHAVLEIEKDRLVPSSASAIIVPISLISDRYIQLEPPYTKGPALKDGDRIELARTIVPSELDDLLGSLKTFLDALEAGKQQDPGALGDAVTNLAKALDGTGDDIDRLLGSSGKIAESINENSPQLESLVVRLSSLMQALSTKSSQIAALNRNLNAALGAVADESAAFDSALTNLALLTQQLGSVVKDHRGALEQDLGILSRTTDAALRHQDSLIQANDWLHVIADGGESSNNGGAIHLSNDPAHPLNSGPDHLDVRESHTSPCGPSCLIFGLPLSGAADLTSGAQDDEAMKPEEETSLLLPSIDRAVPFGPVPPPSIPKPIALGADAPGGQHEQAGFFERLFLAIGSFVSLIFGGAK